MHQYAAVLLNSIISIPLVILRVQFDRLKSFGRVIFSSPRKSLTRSNGGFISERHACISIEYSSEFSIQRIRKTTKLIKHQTNADQFSHYRLKNSNSLLLLVVLNHVNRDKRKKQFSNFKFGRSTLARGYNFQH